MELKSSERLLKVCLASKIINGTLQVGCATIYQTGSLWLVKIIEPAWLLLEREGRRGIGCTHNTCEGSEGEGKGSAC